MIKAWDLNFPVKLNKKIFLHDKAVKQRKTHHFYETRRSKKKQQSKADVDAGEATVLTL